MPSVLYRRQAVSCDISCLLDFRALNALGEGEGRRTRALEWVPRTRPRTGIWVLVVDLGGDFRAHK